VRRYGVDAAIFFSDIVVPLKAVGVELDIVPGVGPVVAQPFRTEADLDRLPALTPEHVPYITESVQALTAELGATPLIGFAGAPFTLASYLVEGGPSKNHAATKALMYGQPDLWSALLDRLATITLGFLRVQVDAGVSAVQLFDSWVGALPAADYRAHVQPHSAGCWRRSPTCRASTSASAPASCCTTWARPARTSSASTGGCRWPTRCGASAPARRCRATSTRRWSSRRTT
jgi:uroporphyrinogen decarboxylase